jgi:uncharacterized protein YutE (UPF0331/DUF86 family)
VSLDRNVLAERASAVERHLARVASKLPAAPSDLLPASDTSDAVILHLWQATQIVIDLALGTCAQLELGAPSGYAEAFKKLSAANVIDPELARRLLAATGFGNVIAHAYESLDMERVHQAASRGPADLRAFLVALRAHVGV